MKKEYKSPSMEVVKLEMQQYLLEGSKIGGGDAPGGSQLAPSTCRTSTTCVLPLVPVSCWLVPK